MPDSPSLRDQRDMLTVRDGARLFGIRVYDVDEQTPELQAWLAEELAELADQEITR